MLCYMFVVVFQVKAHKDLAHFETAYVVKIHNAARLAPSQPVSCFSFSLIFFLSIQPIYYMISILFEVHALFQILSKFINYCLCLRNFMLISFCSFC